MSQLYFPRSLQQDMPSQANNISLQLDVLEEWDGNLTVSLKLWDS